MKPTIGIVGGCGPLATVDIENKILDATKRLLLPLLDQDYFNMLVFNYTQFPDRNDSITTINNKMLLDQFLRCGKTLESIGADLILVACQTAHVYMPDLKSTLNIPIVDIIEETVGYIFKHFPNTLKVGLLSTEATQKKQLYQRILKTRNIEVVTIPDDMQSKIMEAIYIIKAGLNCVKGRRRLGNNRHNKDNHINHPHVKIHPYRKILLEEFLPNPLFTIQEAIYYLAEQSCDHIILGCTELPLILPYIDLKEVSVNVIDPNTIVAESAVMLAKKLEQEKVVFPIKGIDETEERVLKLCVE